MAKTLLEKNVARAIESEGLALSDKTVYGETDVTIHDDGTADVCVSCNGRTFKCVIQLDVHGSWKVISGET